MPKPASTPDPAAVADGTGTKAHDGSAELAGRTDTAGSSGSGNGGQRRDDQYRLNLETWFRGIALMLVVTAVVFYPLYALIFRITGAALADIVAPVTGIAGAVVGYWFGQASRRIPNPTSSDGSSTDQGRSTADTAGPLSGH